MTELYFTHTDPNGVTSSLDCNERINSILMRGYVPASADNQADLLTEQFDLQLRGATAGAIMARIQEINRFFLLAREQKDLPNPVYLWYSPAAGIAAKRSRVVNGRVILGGNVSAGLKDRRLVITVAIERKPYWEGELIQIPLTNPNGTNVTSGLRVYNANDLAGTAPNKRANYADIAAGVIQGDLPAPLKVSAKNLYVNYGDNRDYLGWLWIALGHRNPFSLKHKVEGEDCNPLIGTKVARAESSGGYYLRTDTILPSSGYTTIFSYPFTGADLSAYAGQRMRIFLRVDWNGPIPAFVQLRIRFDEFGWTSDWHSPNATLALGVMELFDIRIPPNLESVGNLSGITMHIDVRTTGFQTFITLDDIMLLPTDGFCEFNSSIPANWQGVIDGIEGLAYKADAVGANRAGLNYLVNSGLDVMPGKAHRLYFLQHLIYGGSWTIDQVISVTAAYRPRWSSL